MIKSRNVHQKKKSNPKNDDAIYEQPLSGWVGGDGIGSLNAHILRAATVLIPTETDVAPCQMDAWDEMGSVHQVFRCVM